MGLFSAEESKVQRDPWTHACGDDQPTIT